MKKKEEENPVEKEMERSRIEGQIRELIAELDAPNSAIGDWKVVKCYEAKLQNKPLPYDLEKLMSDRQKVRDQINELQSQLAELDK